MVSILTMESSQWDWVISGLQRIRLTRQDSLWAWGGHGWLLGMQHHRCRWRWLTRNLSLSLQGATKIYEVPLGIRGRIRVNTSKYYTHKIDLSSCVEQFARSLQIFLIREVEILTLKLTDMILRSRQKAGSEFYSNGFKYSSYECSFLINYVSMYISHSK